MSKKEKFLEFIQNSKYEMYYIMTNNKHLRSYDGFFFTDNDKKYYMNLINRVYQDDLTGIHEENLSISGYYSFKLNKWIILKEVDIYE